MAFVLKRFSKHSGMPSDLGKKISLKEGDTVISEGRDGLDMRVIRLTHDQVTGKVWLKVEKGRLHVYHAGFFDEYCPGNSTGLNLGDIIQMNDHKAYELQLENGNSQQP